MTNPSVARRIHQIPDSHLLLGLILFRAVNSLLVRTYFSPDEYWQALEVGHRITFGYGYLTWEWGTVGLRSVLHPALFAGLYKLLALLGLEDGALFVRSSDRVALTGMFTEFDLGYTYSGSLIQIVDLWAKDLAVWIRSSR